MFAQLASFQENGISSKLKLGNHFKQEKPLNKSFCKENLSRHICRTKSGRYCFRNRTLMIMKNDLVRRSEEQLKKFTDKEKVMRELCKQIRKDFAPEPVLQKESIEYTGVAELAAELMPVLNDMQSSPEFMRQLLYRIDLSAELLYDYLQKEEQENHLLITAWLIVERELKKTATRLYFSENKDAFREL